MMSAPVLLFTMQGELVVMPGLVDTHVHINEPGRTEWEGFTTATRAAVAGGITTLIEMPLNSIPATTSVAGLQQKIVAANGQALGRHRFLGVAWFPVTPANSPHSGTEDVSDSSAF